MSEYYKRQIQFWGEQTQKSLADKSIAIIGCGGLGCSIAYALCTSGIGQVYLVDFDTITLSNLHRQIAFTHEDIGKKKSEVLAQVMRKRISDKVKISSFDGEFKSFIDKDIKLDLILDASDNLQVRTLIDKYAKECNIPWLYASVEEFRGQVCLFEKASFGDFFRADVGQKAQFAPMVMHVASFSASLALRFLSSGDVQKDRLYVLEDFSVREFKLGS